MNERERERESASEVLNVAGINLFSRICMQSRSLGSDHKANNKRKPLFLLFQSIICESCAFVILWKYRLVDSRYIRAFFWEGDRRARSGSLSGSAHYAKWECINNDSTLFSLNSKQVSLALLSRDICETMFGVDWKTRSGLLNGFFAGFLWR